MTRALERRLAALEALFGRRGCTCGGLKCIVVQELQKTEAEIDAEIAQQLPQCAVHGEAQIPVIIVRKFASSTEIGDAA